MSKVNKEKVGQVEDKILEINPLILVIAVIYTWTRKKANIEDWIVLNPAHCYLCVVFQSLSRVWPFATPWTAACQASMFFMEVCWSFLKLMSIESMMPSNHLILCHPLLLLPSIFPNIRVFSNESSLPIKWPKYWSFSFSMRPSNEHSGLISFRTDWFDLLAVQGTLKNLQHHSSILRHSVFFIVQLSHPYMTTGKTIVLTRQTFVSKEMSLNIKKY